MTPEEFQAAMAAIFHDYDQEIAHIEADDLMVKLLTQLGYGEGAAIFDNASKWYA